MSQVVQRRQSQHERVLHQSPGHRSLFLSFVSFFSLPHEDLRPSLVQNVTVLKLKKKQLSFD